MTAMLGGWCPLIENVVIEYAHRHVWKSVHPVQVIHAYVSAVRAARRTREYKPFTRLRFLNLMMSWCAPAAVWRALLALMRSATKLRCVSHIATHDPTVVVALGLLPNITVLSQHCLWPHSFATIMERKSKRTGQYRYVASPELSSVHRSGYPDYGPLFQLAEGDDQNPHTFHHSIQLRSRCNLFTAFHRLLPVGQQVVLARWARSKFHTVTSGWVQARVRECSCRAVLTTIKPMRIVTDTARTRSCIYAARSE